ncbi:hypothetical protein ACGFWI_33605 [Streptomyces sp. NPDC048434]|uniref:hypothetical protein n=1 Tax=Streptomyces sp. NPDC048434 TaxID=3365549 RepID=UPI0037192668
MPEEAERADAGADAEAAAEESEAARENTGGFGGSGTDEASDADEGNGTEAADEAGEATHTDRDEFIPLDAKDLAQISPICVNSGGQHPSCG